MCAAATFVAAAAAGGSSTPVDVTVLHNAAERIVIEYQVNDYTQTAVEIDGVKYSRISVAGEPQMLTAGAPELPHMARSIIIADQIAMDLVVVEEASQYYELFDVDLIPSKGNLPRTIDPASVPYTFGEEYEIDAFFPGELATLGAPYILRDFRGAVVDVYPFQYNPVTRTLRVYTSLTVEVVASHSTAAANAFQRQFDRSLSLSFHQIYQSHFINYEPELRYTPLDETGELLIICYDAWMPNVQPLVDHKNGIGIPTTIVGVSTIGNNYSSIKSHIQGVYDTSDLAFVLLVGDGAQIDTPTASGGSSDPTYAKLAGSDDYPDILVGRFSAETSAHVDTQVLRTIEFEQLQSTQQPWFKRGMGVASAQGDGIGDDGEADWVHMNNIRTDLLGHSYTVVDQIYDTNGGTAADVTSGLNAGRGIINYCGHGSTTSWSTTGFSTSHINALTNDNMLPFIVTVACVNGQFDGYTCFAEAWLRATNGSEPTGAIGCYASSINQSWAPPMCAQDETVDRFVDETYVTLGALCFAGSCQMMDEYGSSGVSMYDTWHLFGEPSLRVVGTTAPPTGLRVAPAEGLISEGNQGGPFTPDSVVYTLENQNETPLDYVVSTPATWLDITNAVGTIPALDAVDVTVSINAEANSFLDGVYQANVSIVNTTDHDGDCARPVELIVGVPVMQYQWTMDEDPGWSTEGSWAWGTPMGQGGQYGGPDPTSGYTGSNVCGYNLYGDYENGMSERHLTSDPIDCSDMSEITLRFQRWLGVERNAYDHAYVRVSNNGTMWNTVWANGSSAVTDSSWTYQEFDISEWASGRPAVYLRWTMGVTDGSWQYCGWNIDDVEIWALAPQEPQYQPGDLNCDGNVDFGDINPFVLALTNPGEYGTTYPGCDIDLGDLNEDGNVDFGDINMFVALLD